MSNFMTNPATMRDYSGRFSTHATDIGVEANKAWQATQSISGTGWTGNAQMASMGSVEEMNQAFRNIQNMLEQVSMGLNKAATDYETAEHDSQRALST